LLVIVLSCKTDETEEAIVTPTPPVITDVVTPQNVKTFMVDKNATTETAALFII
jgi:mannan endo-1,4-beta-mannosidase